ncbi:hypothetical protein BH23GEM9_BH23GEM9_22460 [soil metagenome]
MTAVALVAGPEARASGWAATAAVALAERWHGPRRVVLVDLGLDAPSLHDVAGVRNDEGIADVAEYGVSLGVVRQSAGRGSYDLVATGFYIPDPAAVLRSPAWSRVLAEVAHQRGTLLAYVPADAEGIDAVVRRCGAVLVLADPEEGRRIVERLPRPYSVLAIITPPAPPVEGSDDAAAATSVDGVPGSAAVEDATEVADGAAEADDEPIVVAAGVEELMAAAWDEEPEPGAAAGEPVTAAAADELVTAVAADELVTAAGVDSLTDVAPAVASPAAPAPPAEPAAAAGRAVAAGPGAVQEPARLSDEEFDRIRLPTDRESREALIAELRQRQRAARLSPPADSELARPSAAGAAMTGRRGDARPEILIPDGWSDHARDMRVETMGDEVALDTLDPGERDDTEERRWNRRPLLWTIAVVLLVAVIAGSWRLLSGRVGTGVAADPATPLEVPGPPALPAPAPAPADADLPYAVAMEAHTDLAAALRRLDALESEPGMTFHISPLEREGTLYYHIMAGPVPDSAAALELRDTLLSRRLKTASTPTDVRHTPYAFLVGDYGALDAAVNAMSDLRRLDVPAYTLMSEAADGRPAYRVYVGGFSAPAEAGVMRQILRAAGVTDSLVTRTGSTPR